MNKKMIMYLIRTAQPLLMLLAGSVIFRLFICESFLESVLYSIMVIGFVNVAEAIFNLASSTIKAVRVVLAMNKMSKQLSNQFNNLENKGE